MFVQQSSLSSNRWHIASIASSSDHDRSWISFANTVSTPIPGQTRYTEYTPPMPYSSSSSFSLTIWDRSLMLRTGRSIRNSRFRISFPNSFTSNSSGGSNTSLIAGGQGVSFNQSKGYGTQLKRQAASLGFVATPPSLKPPAPCTREELEEMEWRWEGDSHFGKAESH